MRIIAVVLALLFATAAAQNLYPFHNATQAKRFKGLTGELRCLVCQNETIAASEAPLAADLRQKVYQQILAGKTDQDILNYMKARYGQFVVFKPAVEPATYVLWYAPIVLLLLGVLVLWLIIRHAKNNKTKALSAAEKAQLHKLTEVADD